MSIIDDFNGLTGLKINSYLSKYVYFTSNHLPHIVNYYTGTESIPDRQSFKYLDELIKEGKSINESIIKNERRMDKSEYWDLVDTLEDMYGSLITSDNTSKWVRSTIAKGDFNTNIEVDSVLGQNMTIENLAYQSGYQDFGNSWSTIAIRNDLDEEEYTLEGGNILKVNMVGSSSMVINDVVDRMSGDSIYGKDVDVSFVFEGDDLLTTSGKECVIQCYSILLDLSRGDIPEFPEMGVSAVVGGNMASFSYPTIIRQINDTFHRDDSVDSVGIVDFSVEQDNMVMSLTISSKFGTFIKRGITI